MYNANLLLLLLWQLLIGKQLIAWVIDSLIKSMFTYKLLFLNNSHVKYSLNYASILDAALSIPLETNFHVCDIFVL